MAERRQGRPAQAPSARLLEQATALVGRVLLCEQPCEQVIDEFLRTGARLGSTERSVLTETAYRVLRRRRLYEHLSRSQQGPVARRLAILGFAGEPQALQRALDPDERAWLARCEAVAPGDLPEAARHNLPDWLASRLQAELGEAFWSLVASLDGAAPVDLRVNLLKSRRADAQRELLQAGIAAEPTPLSPWGLRLSQRHRLADLPLYRQGVVEVQDEGSQVLACLVEARRGEVVVDYCAGAGGKTLALGAAMRNQGRVYAMDVSAHRLQALQPRLARSGLDIVHTMAITHDQDERLLRLAGKADRVLVDAPCSGLGTLRRHPDLKWRQTEDTVREMARQQQRILGLAARLVRPGGRLVYATCSLLREENEAVADAFAQSRPDWQPLDVAAILERQGVRMDPPPTAPSASAPSVLRLWPHRHGTDGFFAAAWQRSGRE